MSKLCCLYNENKFYESENMRGYNIIVVYNENADKILMCKRKKEPYKGLANFVGGKIEKNENGLDAAYRELEEETTITKDDITLLHIILKTVTLKFMLES